MGVFERPPKKELVSVMKVWRVLHFQEVSYASSVPFPLDSSHGNLSFSLLQWSGMFQRPTLTCWHPGGTGFPDSGLPLETAGT